MKSFGLGLAAMAVILMLLPAPAPAAKRNRGVRESFFVVNPSFRADVLALEAVEREDGLMWPGASPMLYLNGFPAPDAQDAESWNEIGILGMTISLSRLSFEQGATRGIFPIRDEDDGLRDFWSRLFRGSLQGGDMEMLGDVFRPQINLGIEF